MSNADRYWVKLRRADTNQSLIVSPFNIRSIKRSIESESLGHRRATAPSMSLDFYTEDLLDFLVPYPQSAELMMCDVYHYLLFDDDNRHLVFAGVGEELPVENIEFNDETVTLNFTSVVLTWEETTDMKDADEYYKYISVVYCLKLFDTVYKTNKVSEVY